MYIVWWSGRGYLTILIVLGTLAAFGLVERASSIADGSWFWSAALLLAAGINWHFGSKINRKKRAALRPAGARDRLFYRGRHRFMSVPMESFSLVIAACGFVVLVTPLIGSPA